MWTQVKKNPLEINKEMYCNFKTSYIITVLFSTECHLSHNFNFFYSNNAFFVNHVL
jgi:hypothetical protein